MAIYTIVDTGVIINESEHCEYCKVVPISTGDKYCIGCLNDIVEYLANVWREQIQTEKGWY